MRLQSPIELASNNRNPPGADVPADGVPSFILHGGNFGAPGEIRTPNPRFRRPMLYPLSYGRNDRLLARSGARRSENHILRAAETERAF